MKNWIKGKPTDTKHYLASFITDYNGSRRTIKAYYAPRYTIESSVNEYSYHEYCDTDDTYYDKEGWYEVIENWDDLYSVYVSGGEVTHYQPLPDDPED